MKRIKKLFLILIVTLVLVLCGCNSNTQGGNETPGGNEQTPTQKDPKFYGILNELTYYEGNYYDPLDSITAYDASGADVTDKIQVFGDLPIVEDKLPIASLAPDPTAQQSSTSITVPSCEMINNES